MRHRPISGANNINTIGEKMVHEMQLNDAPFKKIHENEKDIELRLFDEKRRRLNVNDLIIFTNTSDHTLQEAVVITSLHRYATFEDLFHDFSPLRCGFEDETSISEAAAQMEQYYSPDAILALGVLGIGIKVVDLSRALEQREAETANRFQALFPDGMK